MLKENNNNNYIYSLPQIQIIIFIKLVFKSTYVITLKKRTLISSSIEESRLWGYTKSIIVIILIIAPLNTDGLHGLVSKLLHGDVNDPPWEDHMCKVFVHL